MEIQGRLSKLSSRVIDDSLREKLANYNSLGKVVMMTSGLGEAGERKDEVAEQEASAGFKLFLDLGEQLDNEIGSRIRRLVEEPPNSAI